MKILFTGATGVIGSAALPLLLADGHHVSALCRTEVERVRLTGVGARAVTVDLFDRQSIEGAMGGIDVVIHYATSIPPQSSMTKKASWTMNDRLRSEATANLVDAAIRNGVERFIQQSITFAYADGGKSWLDESAPIDPVWEVLDSALTAEGHVARFAEAGGDGVVLRLARLYGPGRASAEHVEAIRGGKLPILGRGTNYVSSLHSQDAATGLAASVTAPPGTYNVTDDRPVTANEVEGSLARTLATDDPRHVPVWIGRMIVGKAAGLLTVSHRVSNWAFKTATGWRPAYPSVVDGWDSVVRAT